MWHHVRQLRTGFCCTVPAFCGQLKWCSGKHNCNPLILLLFHNKWKFYSIFEDSLSDLLTTFVKLAFKMQFNQWGSAIELFFSARRVHNNLSWSRQGHGHKHWIHNILFGGKSDLGIVLPTKSTAVRFVDPKLNEWFGPLENNIILIYEHFRNLNMCIFNVTVWCLEVQCSSGASVICMRSWTNAMAMTKINMTKSHFNLLQYTYILVHLWPEIFVTDIVF